MLASLKPGADFSRGVRSGESATYFSRPTPTAIRELALGDSTLAAHRSGFMQDRSYELSRIPLPRTPVNKLVHTSKYLLATPSRD
jgi:hypothetical protein